MVAAVNGMACGGAFYMLGEADVIVAADHATFFDPHVTYGMVAAYEPILLLRRMPFGEVLRMALAGNYERISAPTAQRLGLVSEVVPKDDLLTAPTTWRDLRRAVAHGHPGDPPHRVGGQGPPGLQGTDLGNLFLQLGTTTQTLLEGQDTFQAGGGRVEPRIRRDPSSSDTSRLRGMRFGLDVAQQRMPWDEVVSRVQFAEELGFDGAWGFDHFQPMYGDGPGEASRA